jgi:pimeloyl-ACP methyl ester carboxylesterase
MSAISRRAIRVLAGLWLLTSLAAWGQAPQRRVSLDVSDAYAFTPPRQVPALQRLGRFQPGSPGTFVPVTGPSNPAGHVYFVTHGWAPGYLDAVKKFQSEGKFPLAWDPNLKNKDGQPYNNGWFQNVSQSILKTDPGATVFFFSWVDWSATSSFFDPQNAQKNTDMAGNALNAAVSAALKAGFPPQRLHLLGHSYGSKVVTVAAVKLKPAHLTLFDSPDRGFVHIVGAGNKLYLPPYLPAIPPSRAAGGTFVDNYYSFFGICYNDRGNALKPIVDYKLVAQICKATDIGCKHGYPMVFYPQASAGPNKNLGLWWSPLLGNQFKTLPPDFEQTWKNDKGDPLAFQTGSKCFGNSGQLFADELSPRSFLERQLFDTTEPPKAALKVQPLVFEPLFAEGGTRIEDGAAILAEPGSSFWHLQFTKEPQDDALEIDVQFRQPGGDDLLGFWIDDDLDRVLSGQWTGREVQTTTINVNHLEDGPHLLTVALHSVADDARAEVEVRNLRKVSFVSGQPATSGDGGNR